MVVSDICAFQQLLDLGETSLVLLGWLNLGVTVGTCDFYTHSKHYKHITMCSMIRLVARLRLGSKAACKAWIAHQRGIAGCDSVHVDKSAKHETS